MMHWLAQSERRQRLILAMHQPLTAHQLASRSALDRDTCSRVLGELSIYGVVECVNPSARRSRLYWLTGMGAECRRLLGISLHQQPIVYRFPLVDWNLYGEVCYSHRAAVVKAVEGQMQAVAIRRRACLQNRQLRMSANNCRDVLYFLRRVGIVKQIRLQSEQHPRYQLTETGTRLQLLLRRAEEHPV